MTRIALALVLSFAPIGVAVRHVDAAGQTCTRSGDYRTPPRSIRVFISHRRGSSVPARIVTVSLRTYVSRVMNGGAWPAHKPIESLKVGAIAIKQYAWWHVLHHQRGYRWRGRC